MKKEYIFLGILFFVILFIIFFITINYKKNVKDVTKVVDEKNKEVIKEEKIENEKSETKENNKNYKIELIKEEPKNEEKIINETKNEVKEESKTEVVKEENEEEKKEESKKEIKKLKYMVTFKYNGGIENIKGKEVTYLENYGELPETSKIGYTFLGWYTKDNKKIESTDVVTNKRNQTLYAHYSINSYVIKYDYNYLKDNLYKDLDNKEYWNQDYEILLDEELFLNQNIYKFNLTNNILRYNENIKLEKDKTYTYSVYLKTNIEQEIELGFENDLTKVKVNENFKRITKTFKLNEDSNGEFIFKFDENIKDEKYLEIYDLSISEGEENIDEVNKNYNEKIKMNEDPIREGYTFKGWYKDSSFKEKVDNDIVIENATYYAKWDINLYTLKVDPNKGIYDNSMEVKEYNLAYNTKMKLEEPSASYKITYDLNNNDVVIDKNEDFILRKFKNWTDEEENIIENTYVFNKNMSIKANYEDNVNTNVVQIVKEGYTCFWNTKKDGTGIKYDKDIIVDKDITLYAICTKNIKFERPINNGTITSNYGTRIHPVTNENKFHSGIDMAGSDKNIYPILPGVVAKTGNNSSMGNYVIIYHTYNNQKYTSAYYHLEKKNVRKGQNVTQDTIIGIMGQTGVATGVHLHLTMYKGYLDMEEATMIDPKDVIDFPNNWSSKMY